MLGQKLAEFWLRTNNLRSCSFSLLVSVQGMQALYTRNYSQLQLLGIRNKWLMAKIVLQTVSPFMSHGDNCGWDAEVSSQHHLEP